MAKTFRLELRASLDNLAEIRSFVGETARELGLDGPAIEDVKVCVDEAATNIVKHGYGSKEGDLSVELYREDGEVVVRIVDRAPPFDPELATEPELGLPLHDRPVGGMGVYLMKTLTDGLSHSTNPGGGNELVLRKRIAAGGNS